MTSCQVDARRPARARSRSPCRGKAGEWADTFPHIIATSVSRRTQGDLRLASEQQEPEEGFSHTKLLHERKAHCRPFRWTVVHDDSQNVGNEKGWCSLLLSRWNNIRDLSADGGYLCGLVSWVFRETFRLLEDFRHQIRPTSFY